MYLATIKPNARQCAAIKIHYFKIKLIKIYIFSKSESLAIVRKLCSCI